jgi:nicotinamidase/pyrazinamidase
MSLIYIDKATTASGDIDAQNSFTPLCPKELPIYGGDEIVPFLNKNALFSAIRFGTKCSHPANSIWIATEENPQGTIIKGDFPNLDFYWNAHCIVGSYGAQLINGLPKEKNYDFFVWKGLEIDIHPYGACFHDLQNTLSTGIIEYLFYNKIKTVILGGLALDHCVKATAIQLAKAGFRVIVNLESCRGINKEDIQNSILEMKSFGVIIIKNTDELEIS